MTRVAHISDLHIGHHQWGIKERQVEQRQNLKDLAGALEEYDIVVITGDVFDSPSPTPSDVFVWMDFCDRLDEAGVLPVYIAGNHDKVVGSAFQWVDLAAFTQREVSGGVLKIGRISHRHRKDLKSAIDDALPDEHYDIIAMHQSAGGFLPSIMRPELDDEDMKVLSSKCQYLALGDLHVHKIMKLPNGCIAAYPGPTFFLKLGEAHDNFKFIELEYDDSAHKIVDIKSVPYEPRQKSQVLQLKSAAHTHKELETNRDGFNIIRYSPEQEDEMKALVLAASEDFPNILIHCHRDKPPKKKEEGSEEGVTEDTDFISLVEKEASLEERDVQLIDEMWNNPSSENVEGVLEKDLKQQLNASNKTH